MATRPTIAAGLLIAPGEVAPMRVGVITSILVGIAGALLRFAAAAQVAGFKAHSTGVVLMVAGVVGVVASLLFRDKWASFKRRNRAHSGDTILIARVTALPVLKLNRPRNDPFRRPRKES